MENLLSKASAFVGLLPMCDISIDIADADRRSRHTALKDGQPVTYLVFSGDDAVSGEVHFKFDTSSRRLDHVGIKVEFIGSIELVYGSEHEFVSLERELQPPGALTQSLTTFPFDFSAVEKAHESYNGMNVTLRYFLRVTISRSLAPNITQEMNIWVQSPAVPASTVTDFNPIKMEVGIEDCLHIEFEYNKTKYHLKDVVIGKIYFLLVRLKIKHMELEVRRRESTGTGSDLYNESETITKFEIMDGAPVRGECVPVRLFLSSFDLTPTYRNVNNKFSVKYFLNLVLVDEDDRRYFKQQEIILYRLAE